MREYADILKELEAVGVDALDEARTELVRLATEAAEAEAEYERLKAGELIRLKTEEDGNPKIKRTDAIRQAIYRDKFAVERLRRALSAKLFDIEKLAYRGLLAKVSALQTLAKRDEL